MGSDWADLFLSPRFDRSAHYVLAHYVCANHHGANMSIVHQASSYKKNLVQGRPLGTHFGLLKQAQLPVHLDSSRQQQIIMQYEKKESILTMEASEINNIPMHHKVY